MSFRRITAFVIVEDSIAEEISEQFLSLIDSLAIKKVAVFDSDVVIEKADGVPNAKEMRREFQSHAEKQKS